VPMERTPPRFINQPEGDPPQQQEKVEILVSTERPGITQVFGTVQPPSGLAGMIRRLAFKSSHTELRPRPFPPPAHPGHHVGEEGPANRGRGV